MKITLMVTIGVLIGAAAGIMGYYHYQAWEYRNYPVELNYPQAIKEAPRIMKRAGSIVCGWVPEEDKEKRRIEISGRKWPVKYSVFAYYDQEGRYLRKEVDYSLSNSGVWGIALLGTGLVAAMMIMGVMLRPLAYLGASVIAVMLVGAVLPSWGIDCVFRGRPFKFEYTDIDGTSFNVAPFLLDIAIYVVPASVLLYLGERGLGKRGVKEAYLKTGHVVLIVLATILLLWVCTGVMMGRYLYFE